MAVGDMEVDAPLEIEVRSPNCEPERDEEVDGFVKVPEPDAASNPAASEGHQSENENESENESEAAAAAAEEEEEAQRRANEQRALQEVGKIKQAVDRLELRLNTVDRHYTQQATQTAALRWMHAALRRIPNSYNKLGAAKVRTEAGLVVENLMKSVLELDAVEAMGSQVVRDVRRAQVRRINNELLPRADSAMKRIDKLVATDKRIQELVAHVEASAARAMNVEGIEEGEPEGARKGGAEEDAEMSDASAEEAAGAEEDAEMSDASAEEAADGPASPASAPAAQTLPEPRHEVDERSYRDFVAINVAAAHGPPLTLQRVGVQVERSTGELTVSVPGHRALTFDVRAPGLAPLETSYKVVAPGVVQVRIPRARARRAAEPFGYRRRQPQRTGPARFRQSAPSPAAWDRFVPIWS